MISKKQSFYLEDMPSLKLKKFSNLKKYDPRESFRDEEFVYKALISSLRDGDAEAFKEILGAFLEVTSKDEFAKRAKVSKRTLYRMLSPAGNPTLSNIALVIHALSKAA